MKTKEEILTRALNNRCKYESSKEMDFDTHLAIMDAMQAYHEAKMKEVTDKDIEVWANSKEKIIEEMPETLKLHITKKIECRIKGAKAMRDGEIKHNER